MILALAQFAQSWPAPAFENWADCSSSSLSLNRVLAQASSNWSGFTYIAIALIIVVMIIMIRTSRSIREIQRAAERFADGDLTRKLSTRGPRPISDLASALNRMAVQLDDRMHTVVQQRNELGAVLNSMVEGVMAIDQDERLISLNPAAASMLGIDATRVIGRPVQEVVRVPALQQFVARVLAEDEDVHSDLEIRVHAEQNIGPHYRAVQATGAALRDASGHRFGGLIVLHDITQVRRLEQVRRDFVANVSHELKTPITTIKAAVETLMDSGDNDPATNERFLNIISRQAERLHAIVEDLLCLARIEEDTKRHNIVLEPGSIADVLTSASETCKGPADAKGIRIEVDCDDDPWARINAPLLGQAVVNLLDNAIKYSPDESTVHIGVHANNGSVIIAVEDEGCGIEPEHLPRLFERFYRTDRARSRALGGTGLGLAIVKHITQAHGGHVTVESTPGRGSTFRLHLPAIHEEPQEHHAA